MLDWIFEGIVDWTGRTTTRLMDSVSGLFLEALGTDMTVMEAYFPFVNRAFTVLQYMAWAILFLITVWQLFRAFGGPLTEAENPYALVARSALFALLIWFAKPIFLYVLQIAKAPYTALMDLPTTSYDFSFAGIEAVMRNGLTNLGSTISVVGEILVLILMLALGWNYFKLLLEVVERYVVVGVLCYTSPLAYSMGASKATGQVFKSWCRMVGSQLLLLIMNVWFLRAFNSSVGQYVARGGAISGSHGSVFLWLFCAIAFLKTAQRFDAYLSAMGLNVAQTGTGMGMELLMAMRVVTGMGSGFARAGHAFAGGVPSGTGGGIMAGLANKFKGNSYVRDAVVQGGQKMGMGGSIGFFGRMFGGIAARNGATLSGSSISSVASKTPDVSGKIAGSIADRSLSNYMPHLSGKNLSNTEISGGKISTKSIGADGKETSVDMYNTAQFEKPNGAHSVVTASDGTQWYQTAQGAGAKDFFETPQFTGGVGEEAKVAATFPNAEDGISLRTIGDGQLAVSTPNGETMWYSSAFFEEPDIPHTVIQSADGVDWYALKPNAEIPEFESGTDATAYNQAQFEAFMPGYEQAVVNVDGSQSDYGHFEVRHEDGSGTAFYDATQFSTPRGDYQVYEDVHGNQWYGVHGEAAVERRPVYEDGAPVYEGENVKTVSVETVKYRGTPSRYAEPSERKTETRAPSRKRL